MQTSRRPETFVYTSHSGVGAGALILAPLLITSDEADHKYSTCEAEVSLAKRSHNTTVSRDDLSSGVE